MDWSHKSLTKFYVIDSSHHFCSLLLGTGSDPVIKPITGSKEVDLFRFNYQHPFCVAVACTNTEIIIRYDEESSSNQRTLKFEEKIEDKTFVRDMRWFFYYFFIIFSLIIL